MHFLIFQSGKKKYICIQVIKYNVKDKINRLFINLTTQLNLRMNRESEFF